MFCNIFTSITWIAPNLTHSILPFCQREVKGLLLVWLLVLRLRPINCNWHFLQQIIDHRFILYPTYIKNISDNNEGMCIYIVDIANICVECSQKPHGILKDYQWMWNSARVSWREIFSEQKKIGDFSNIQTNIMRTKGLRPYGSLYA